MKKKVDYEYEDGGEVDLEKIVDDIRQTMEDQKIQEGIDSTSPEGEDAIFIKKRSYKNGGRVRGSGIARKGIRECKMR